MTIGCSVVKGTGGSVVKGTGGSVVLLTYKVQPTP